MSQSNPSSNYTTKNYKFGKQKKLIEISSESIYNSSYVSDKLDLWLAFCINSYSYLS